MSFVPRHARKAIFILGMLLAQPLAAYDREIGARPMGMGDAFGAIADGVHALNYNPSGLALMHDLEASLEYANIYPGLDEGNIQENHLVYAQTLGPAGGIGVAWNNRSVYGVYYENEWVLGYALQPFPSMPLWTGLNAKLFYLGYTDLELASVRDYFADGSTKFQPGVDWGCMVQLLPLATDRPEIRVGLSVFNLNEPDFGLHHQHRLPIETRISAGALGVSWDGALDAVIADSQVSAQAGLEKWFDDRRWGVRGGLKIRERSDVTWTLGGSYAFEVQSVKCSLNYAFNYFFSGIKETAGVHRLSLDVFFPIGLAGPTQAASQSGASSAAADPQKVARIKAFLMEKLQSQIALSQKLAAWRATIAPAYADDLKTAERLSHEAIGQLVLYQDIIGFLRKLQAAQDQAERLEMYMEAR